VLIDLQAWSGIVVPGASSDVDSALSLQGQVSSDEFDDVGGVADMFLDGFLDGVLIVRIRHNSVKCIGFSLRVKGVLQGCRASCFAAAWLVFSLSERDRSPGGLRFFCHFGLPLEAK